MSGPYREQGLGAYRDELLARRREELILLDPSLVDVFARRVGRVAAGTVGVVAAVAMAWGAIVGAATSVLLGAWPLMVIAYLLAQPLAAWWLRRELRRGYEESGDVPEEVTRFDQPVAAAALGHADRLERRSVAMPLSALALLGPLTVHWLAASLLSGAPMAASEFDVWIKISLLLVGHAHLVVVYRAWKFADDLRRRSADELHYLRSDGLKALGAASAWSILPGGVLFFVPPILVAVTGFLVVPVSFGAIRNRVADERAQLRLIVGGGAAP